MAAPVKGDVVILPFPFSDLTQAKRRPALVLTVLAGDDVILCQITSQTSSDPHAVPLADADFTSGGLRQESRIRPNRVFTADRGLILYSAGHLKPAKVEEAIGVLVDLLRR